MARQFECPSCRNVTPHVVGLCGRCGYVGRGHEVVPCSFAGCGLPSYARPERNADPLCRGHYAQAKRGGDLHPLRAPDAPARIAVAVRVSPECAARVSDNRDGAREALERWALGRR